jgi:hypothetical protein
MIQPPGTHLAELNFGTLRHDWDDPRVAEFVTAIGRVNAVAARSPGFVWRLDDDAMEAEQIGPGGAFGRQARLAATLSVWTDAESLGRFVEATVHGRFLARGAEWFEPGARGFLVLWWVPAGHLPTVAEGLARHRRRMAEGDSAEAFGWGWPASR